MAEPDGPSLQYRLLGGLAAVRNGASVDLGGRKQRAVLAVLLLHAGRSVTADALIDHVWGDRAPPRADASLQAYVSKLRRLLGPHGSGGAARAIASGPGGYRLETEGAAIDLVRFHDLVADASAALAIGDPATAADRYDAALALHAPVLPEFAGEPWVADAAARTEAVHADALDGAFDAKLALGGGRDLVAGLEAAVAAHPFHERLRGHLALALYRAGRQTDALRSLTDARRTLADEVGVDPGPELRQLEADILAHAPHLAPPAAAGPGATGTARAPRLTPPPAAGPTAVVPGAGAGGQIPGATGPSTVAGGPGAPRNPGPQRATEAGSVAAPDGPPGLAGLPGGERSVGLVGRGDELALLVDAARRAADGEGRTVVISGEPGIGKTRLAEELIAALPGVGRPDGPLVAWARCQEGAASAPYWGYTQIAEQILDAGVISDDAREGISAAGGGVHTIDPAADRFALHSSMVAALRSSVRPIVIVADDLQWADPSSLRALEFVAAALSTVPVLLVATVRSTGADTSPALVACLAQIARQPGSLRIDLAGLSAAEVGTWLGRRQAATAAADRRAAALAGSPDVPVSDDVARVVHERTGGSPFFVGEMVELLARDGLLTDVTAARAARVPAAALDVVRRRVSLLPGGTQQLLASASVLGLTIELDVLAHVAGLAVPETLETLDPAVEAGLLTEDRAGPARLRFAHALIADALAAELSLTRRARLHAAVVDALEDLRAAGLDDHLPELVHHAREGALAGAAPRAFDYAVRAARAAGDQLAFEAAAAYWREARDLLDLARPGDRGARYEVLHELGRSLQRADDVSGAQDALLEAMSVAEAAGDPEGARRAAGALAATTTWQTSPYGQVNERLIRALERVLDGLDATPTAERAQLLGALADATYYEPDPARCLALSVEALDTARRTGDPQALAQALALRLRALWRPLPEDERAELADELVGLVDRGLVTVTQAALAHLSRASVAIERADRARFEADLARARVLAEQARLPGLLSEIGWAEVFWLAALGRFDEAADLARETHRSYRRGWQADDILTSFEVAMAHDHGDLTTALDAASSLLDGGFPQAAREMMAWMLAEVGQLDRAREVVGSVGVVPDAPPDWLWFKRTTAAAQVRARLGDRDACVVLRERLAPFAGRLDLGAGPFFGGADLALAAVCETIGDLPAARHHAAAAVGTLEAVGTRPALARALLLQSRVLARVEDPGERERAAAARARARGVAEELRLVPVLDALDAAGTIDLRSADADGVPAAYRMQAGSKARPS